MNPSAYANGILRAACHPCQQCRFTAADASLEDHILIGLELAIKEEREACARLAESMDDGSYDAPPPKDVAAAIRARNHT